MPMIKQFPGPRTALLWCHARQHLPLALWGLFVFPFATFVGLHQDESVNNHLFVLLFLGCIVFLPLDLVDGTASFQRRLPVTTRALARLDLGLTLCLALWALLCHSMAIYAFAPSEQSLPMWLIPAAVATAMVALVVRRSMEAGDGKLARRMSGPVLLFSTLVFAAFSLKESGLSTSLFSSPARPVPFAWLWVSVSIPIILRIGYKTIVVYVTHARHGDDGSPTDYPFAWVGRVILDEIRSRQLPPKRISTEPPRLPSYVTAPRPDIEYRRWLLVPPFASRFAAQAWFELNALWRDRYWSVYPKSAVAITTGIVLAPGGLDDNSFLSIVAFACAVVFLFRVFDRTGDHLAHRLPLSDWTASTLTFPLAVCAIASVITPLSVISCLWSVFSGEDPFVGLTGIAPVIVALWVGWISLAFCPVMLLYSLCMAYVSVGAIRAPLPFETLATASCVAFLGLMVYYPGRATRRQPRRIVGVVSLVSVLAGLFLLPHLPGSPLLHWTVRELLGSGLVLALIHHGIGTNLIPARAGATLRRALVVGATLGWLVAFLFGPFNEPVHGIAAIYLGLGVVPPLFMPFIVAPKLRAAMRFADTGNTKAMTSRSWMK